MRVFVRDIRASILMNEYIPHEVSDLRDRKNVDISFGSALKFWVAFLIILIIARMTIFVLQP
jgi:hypothetical protein